MGTQGLFMKWFIWLALTSSQLIYAFLVYMHPRLGNYVPHEPQGDAFLIPFAVVGAIEAVISILLHLKCHRQLQKPGLAYITFIISLAMNESICIFGFILGYVAQDVPKMIPFSVAGLLLNLFMFPRRPPQAER